MTRVQILLDKKRFRPPPWGRTERQNCSASAEAIDNLYVSRFSMARSQG